MCNELDYIVLGGMGGKRASNGWKGPFMKTEVRIVIEDRSIWELKDALNLYGIKYWVVESKEQKDSA